MRPLVITSTLAVTILLCAGCLSLGEGQSASGHREVALSRKKYSPDQYPNVQKLKIVSGAMGAYLEKHHNRFPSAAHWEEAIKPYWSDKSRPFSVSLNAVKGQQVHRLAMNSHLSQAQVDDSYRMANTIMLYETVSAKRDANGDPDKEPALHSSSPVHPLIVYVDGHLAD